MIALYALCLLIGYHDGEHVKSFNYFSFEQKDLKTIGNFENRWLGYSVAYLMNKIEKL